MFKKNKESFKDNIFRQITKKCDLECHLINCQSNQSCYCDKEGPNIRRICFREEISQYESNVYLTLLSKNSNITNPISINKNEIIYHLKNHCSLRKFLEKNINNISLIMNELFLFIHSFKNYHFIHGNLHIDNIFIDELMSSNTKIIFKVVDLCYSYFYFNDPVNKRYSYEEKIKNYWDFCSMYLSLSIFLNSKGLLKNKKFNIDILHMIKMIIISYIGNDIFQKFLINYNDYLNTETPLKIKYKSI